MGVASVLPPRSGGADSLLAPWLAQAGSSAPALRAGELQLSHAQLLARVAAHTAALRAAGVQCGDVVALPAERAIETIAAMLACIACGAAYLPLDLDFPPARLAAMLDDAAPRCFYASATAQAPTGIARIEPAAAITVAVVPELTAGELAYVLFTSGSTGRPKGVAMRSAALAGLLAWHLQHPRLGRGARTLQFAPLGFDVSFQEIFTTLAAGGCLVLPSDAERRDPYALLALLARERIERLFVPHVALQALAEAVAAGGVLPAALRDIITAGEPLHVTPAIRALFVALPGAVLHNHYGPTETHVVTAHELDGDPAQWPAAPPIGRALPHVRTRIVDAALVEVAAGAEGELLLGGACLAAGYIHRPELTAERFILLDGTRWYRSGDRVRDVGGGVLDCLGRLDDQIKIDGFRIEPAEVEAVLADHDAVAAAVVVACDAPAGRRLVAHVVARDAHADPHALALALQAHCAASLAAYLVPQAVLMHAALPLTASGKVDRRALAATSATEPLQWREDAPLVEQLRELWQHLLGVARLDVHANLFDHGARSLLVVAALTELRRHGHVLGAAQVYEHPTIAAQAAVLAAPAAAAGGSEADPARAAARRAAFTRFGARSGGGR